LLIEAAVAFLLTLQQANRGREAVNIGSWPEVKCKGGTPCDDLLEPRLQADRVILATAGTMRRVGGLKRALMDTVRGC
jgi:hypothetical protein